MIAALFVQRDGAYYGLEGVDPWDIERDARKYDGPHSVVAHPPCHLWVNLAAVNWKVHKKTLPAWYPGGDDGGCFASALESVRKFGGVLEHPAGTKAWRAHGLVQPSSLGWQGSIGDNDWVCEVWQSAYGHKARKRTWLYYVGVPPFELCWSAKPGTHQVGWFDRNKPTLGKKAANATPTAFRDALINLARHSRAGTRAA